MKDHVTVIPEDNVVIVDKNALFFDLPQNMNIHAIQWHEGKGHIEGQDGTPNTEISGETQYKQYVKIGEDLGSNEKDRISLEEVKPKTLIETKENDIQNIKYRLNEIDFQLIRSMSEILNNTNTEEDKTVFVNLMKEKHTLQDALIELTTINN